MYRSSADRRAEAARAQEISELAFLPIVPLRYCEYNKERRTLKLASEFMGMPAAFLVKSHKTGKEIHFKAIDSSDPLFDQDGWDGEQQIYRPVGGLDSVDHMVIYHAW